MNSSASLPASSLPRRGEAAIALWEVQADHVEPVGGREVQPGHERISAINTFKTLISERTV